MCAVDELNANLIAGTEEPTEQPFLSPDGKWIGYFSIMERTLVASQVLRETFESAGLHASEAGVLVQEVASTYSAYANRIAAGGDSILAELDSLEFEAGLNALRAHAARIDPQAVTEPIDYFVFNPWRTVCGSTWTQ